MVTNAYKKAVEIVYLALIATLQDDVQEVERLLEEAVRMSDQIQMNLDYLDLKKALALGPVASTLLAAADEAAAELYFEIAVEKIVNVSNLLHRKHPLLRNVKAQFATQRLQLMRLLEHYAFEALQNDQFGEAELLAAQMLRVDENSLLNLRLRHVINQAIAA